MNIVYYILIALLGSIMALGLKKAIDYIPIRLKANYAREKRINWFVIIEILTILSYLLLYYKYSFSIKFVSYAFLMAILISVFFIDIDYMIIPNILVVVGVIGSAIVMFTNIIFTAEEKWWSPLLGLIPGCGFLLFAYLIGLILYKNDSAIGMGDIKLFAPIGIFLGWRLCTMALILSVLIEGVIGLTLILLRIKKRKESIPLAPAICIGTFLAMILN